MTLGNASSSASIEDPN
jgi:hypothetical protein